MSYPAISEVKENQPVHLTIKDLCVRFRKSRATIYRLIKNGELPEGAHFGQGRLWRESDIEAFETKLFGGAA